MHVLYTSPWAPRRRAVQNVGRRVVVVARVERRVGDLRHAQLLVVHQERCDAVTHEMHCAISLLNPVVLTSRSRSRVRFRISLVSFKRVHVLWIKNFSTTEQVSFLIAHDELLIIYVYMQRLPLFERALRCPDLDEMELTA